MNDAEYKILLTLGIIHQNNNSNGIMSSLHCKVKFPVNKIVRYIYELLELQIDIFKAYTLNTKRMCHLEGH